MNLKYILLAIIIIPLSPVLIIQGWIIQHKLKKLPEAEGNSGLAGNKYKKHKSILIIGESTMAGVGINEHREGFAGTLAQELSTQLEIKISWQVHAKRGFTAKQVTRYIVPEINEKQFDLIVVGLGGNDTFAIRNPYKWIKHINELIELLHHKFNNTPVAFLNLPPIKDFPAFSFLMKKTMGNLVFILNNALKEFITNQPKVYFNSEPIQLKNWIKEFEEFKDSSNFFSDGVHPSELTYKLWAKDFSRFLLSKRLIKNQLIH